MIFSFILSEFQIIDVGVKKPVTFAIRSGKAQGILTNNANMMALHNGSRVFVRKDDILKIFTDKAPLYSIRLATLVFGEENLKTSCMPDEADSQLTPLNSEILESVISKCISSQSIHYLNKLVFL